MNTVHTTQFPFPERGPGNSLNESHSRLPGEDGSFSKLKLHGHFYQATDNDNPESNKSGPGSQCGCGNQFTRTNYGG